MTKRFEELIAENLATYRKKNSDYNNDSSGYENIIESEEIGIPAWKGVLVRMSDKWGRIKTLAKGKEALVKDESIKDTLKDLANYSLICIELIEREESKNGNKTN